MRGSNIRGLQRSEDCSCVRAWRASSAIRPGHNIPRQRQHQKGRYKVKERELSLIQGFLLCLRDSEAIRLQTSRWKRSLLVFSSGVCLEIALLPFVSGLFGYELSWYSCLSLSEFLAYM